MSAENRPLGRSVVAPQVATTATAPTVVRRYAVEPVDAEQATRGGLARRAEGQHAQPAREDDDGRHGGGVPGCGSRRAGKGDGRQQGGHGQGGPGSHRHR